MISLYDRPISDSLGNLLGEVENSLPGKINSIVPEAVKPSHYKKNDTERSQHHPIFHHDVIHHSIACRNRPCWFNSGK
jgi:hypothetical protein